MDNDTLTIGELTTFATANLPPRWRLDISFTRHSEAVVILYNPSGDMVEPFDDGYPDVISMVLSRVNCARDEEGMDEVELPIKGENL